MTGSTGIKYLSSQLIGTEHSIWINPKIMVRITNKKQWYIKIIIKFEFIIAESYKAE